MDALRKQKLQNARFQCALINWQLRFLDFKINEARRTYQGSHPLPVLRSFWRSLNHFGDDDRERTLQVVFQECFDPENLTHIYVIAEFIGCILEPETFQEKKLLQEEDCRDEIVERWLVWEDIERRIGFCLPFTKLWKLPDPSGAVNEALPRIWSAIRAMAPFEVGEKEKNEAGLTNRRGLAFQADE